MLKNSIPREGSVRFFALAAIDRLKTLVALVVSLSAAVASAQTTLIRVGTNAGASTEAVLLSVARDAGILKQNQLDVEVVYIAGGTLAMQALVGKSLDFLCTGGTPFIHAYLE